MTLEEFYGPSLPAMQAAEEHILSLIAASPYARETEDGLQSVLYCRSRLKSPESMTKKLQKRGFPVTAESALTNVHDAVGVRAVCAFTDDVYALYAWLLQQPSLTVTEVKDYIAFPKPNGYRSLHLIVRISEGPGEGVTVELQIRTIATDCWAALEHQIKYKREVSHAELMEDELKRCADEIASVDLSMQTLRDIIRSDAMAEAAI